MTDKTPTPCGSDSSAELQSTGHNDLWLWFGLSYAGWLTIPRVLMHEMPDDWQKRMAALLNEWDDAWDTSELPSTRVQAVDRKGRITRFPAWLLNYRHPSAQDIDSVRASERPARRATEERTVFSIPDADLLRRAVRNVTRSRPRRKEFAWAAVSDAFGLGSTYSMQLCRRFDLDPDTGAELTPPNTSRKPRPAAN